MVSLLLLFQVISGLGLTMYYSPSVVSAFSSVLNIVGQAHLGWLNRSIHRWSGSSMVSALILHAFRVYLTGYSLAWDQVAYWACHSHIPSPNCNIEFSYHSLYSNQKTRYIWTSITENATKNRFRTPLSP